MIGVLDLHAAFVKPLLAPIALTDGNKTGVECTGGGVPANFLVDVGAGGGNSVITIEESAALAGPYTALNDSAGNQVTFTLVAGNAGTSQIKTGNRSKLFVRAVVASTGGTIVAGVNLIEGNVYAADVGQAAGAQTNYNAS